MSISELNEILTAKILLLAMRAIMMAIAEILPIIHKNNSSIKNNDDNNYRRHSGQTLGCKRRDSGDGSASMRRRHLTTESETESNNQKSNKQAQVKTWVSPQIRTIQRVNPKNNQQGTPRGRALEHKSADRRLEAYPILELARPCQMCLLLNEFYCL